MNFCETQRTPKLNINIDCLKINAKDILQNFYENVPRHFWRIAKTNTIFKHPLSKFFAVENTYHDTNQTYKASHKENLNPVNRKYS